MKSKTMEKHKKKTPIDFFCGIITLSDSKSKNTGKEEDKDLSGLYIKEELEKKYKVGSYKIIPDSQNELLDTIESMISDNISVIVTTGGTGIGSRDITVETVQELFEKELTGFGEIFRFKTYEELGSGAILSRATAGVYKKTLIISMPGSPNAVKLGLSLVINELGHLVKHLRE
ncbi:MAG: molybdenum cofactor biosynthesis protein MoaB [Methanobrevibacter sp.]|jgi:molybdenum cofactor biosynthesis protein B|nr:molybdenum cofactor biosynthesis protein MoaB [Methanobrevibacter sp.]